jgi:predicted amidohydrolase
VTASGGLTPPGSALRLLLASICCEKGAWKANLQTHRKVLQQAGRAGCQLAVFPEMSLTGSIDPQRDAGSLITVDSEPVMRMARLTQEYSVGAVFGIAEKAQDGASHITQIYACQGRVMGVYRKRHLGEDEDGFSPGTDATVFNFGSLRFGIAICAETAVDFPFDEAKVSGAELVLLCSAPGLYTRRTDEESWRRGYSWWESTGLGAARRHAERTSLWIAMTTQGGSTVDEDFPGLAAVVSPKGNVVERLPDWREGNLVVEIPLDFEVDPPRDAARVLVIDDAGRTLLVRFTDNAGYEWLATPGGGLEPSEDHLQAAKRELREELGREDIEIGPEIGWRSHTLAFNGGPWVTQRERWFVAKVEPFEVTAETLGALEPEYVTDVRWWSVDDLARSGAVTSPRNLVDLVTQVISGRLPAADTDLGL